MTSSTNYKGILYEKASLTPICGEPTFEALHKLQNKIKANTKADYSNIGGGAYGHLGLVLTNAQYSLLTPTSFVYPNRPGPLIILYGTTFHVDSNMRIAHTK